MIHIAPIYKKAPDGLDYPVAAINSYPWDENSYKPESYCALYAVKGEGIHARLWSYEVYPRCVCTERDDPVYTDSCLEFFLMPFEDDDRYINIEVNRKGVYLSQIGTCREDRVFIKEITSLEPIIHAKDIKHGLKRGWEIEIILPEAFLSAVYGKEFKLCERKVRCNFYKCGDETEKPHYGSRFPVKTEKPDFHRPEFFGEITLYEKE